MAVTKADYESAVELKTRGNAAFRNEDYKSALKDYCLAISYLGMDSNASLSHFVTDIGGANPYTASKCSLHEKQTNALRLVLFNNMAQVYLKTDQFDLAVERTSRVLASDKTNTKALFRRAVAYRKLKQYHNAQSDLKVLKEMRNRGSINGIHIEVIDAEIRLVYRYLTSVNC